MKYLKGNWKYRTLSNESYESGIKIPYPVVTDYISMSTDGRIDIRAGYAWDGASGPALDTKSFMRGSLFHDASYQLMREEKVSLVHLDEFDVMLVNICEEDGMWSLRRWWVYRGVKIGSGPAANPRNLKVLEAP